MYKKTLLFTLMSLLATLCSAVSVRDTLSENEEIVYETNHIRQAELRLLRVSPSVVVPREQLQDVIEENNPQEVENFFNKLWEGLRENIETEP